MGSIPSLNRALEIPMTNVNNFLASVAHLFSTPATRTRSSSSSTDRSHPSKESRHRAYSSANFTSRNSSSISYRERRIWHNFNIHLKLMECLELEVKAHILAR
jgi:hypothetical protein